jgi:hypothetical protein
MRALALVGLVLVGCGSRSVTSSAPDSAWVVPVKRDGQPPPYPDLPIWRNDGTPPYYPDTPMPVRTCQSYCVTKTDCGVAGFDCAGGKCVQCKTDGDCTYGIKKCDTPNGVCRFCATDAHCVLSGVKLLTGKCDTTLGQCLKCSNNVDCAFSGSPYKLCNLSTGRCVMCNADADCSSSPYKRCDTKTGSCSLCMSKKDCCDLWPNPAACNLTCDQSSGRCACASDAECVMPNSGALKWRCQ